MLKQDLERAYASVEGSRAHKVQEALRSPGVQAVIVYRAGQWVARQSRVVRMLLKPVVVWQRHRLRRCWGIDIGPEAQIGPGFMINHYGGIFIAGDTVAGEFLTITHDITIGYSRSKNRRGFPTLGNNVYIAPGAKLAGRIRVGDNVKIGSNAVVECDVPDNAVVQIPKMLTVVFPVNAADVPHW